MLPYGGPPGGSSRGGLFHDDAERPRRVVQRSLPRRVPRAGALPDTREGSRRDRALARRLQHRALAQRARLPDSEGLRRSCTQHRAAFGGGCRHHRRGRGASSCSRLSREPERSQPTRNRRTQVGGQVTTTVPGSRRRISLTSSKRELLRPDELTAPSERSSQVLEHRAHRDRGGRPQVSSRCP
jgi:hypothetical protein